MSRFQGLRKAFICFNQLRFSLLANGDVVNNRVKEGFLLNGNGAAVYFHIAQRAVSKEMSEDKVIALFRVCPLQFGLNV